MITPASLDSPSKEYIYAGAALIATEEPPPIGATNDRTTIGVFRPSTNYFFLRNTNSMGPPDHTVGLISITIEDYSGGSSGIVVERETGSAPERAGAVARRGPHWRSKNEMKLEPGRYIVHMADLPANRALLVVKP